MTRRLKLSRFNITPLNSGFIEIFQPRTPPPPPPPPPTISLTAIAITNPNSATSIVNASAAHAGFPIIGITSEVEDGRTVTITIVNSANQVVYTGTTTVTNGSWLLEISSAAAKLIPDGNYTVIADVTNASGNTGARVEGGTNRHGSGGAEPAGPDCSIRQRQLERGQNHQCHHADGDRQRRRGRRHGDAVRHQRHGAGDGGGGRLRATGRSPARRCPMAFIS